jgi:endoplasmic reticulum junction formation protein lunapark
LQKQPEDFGQILASFAHDIQKRETRLNEIRLRERRATLLVTMYTFAGWGAYLGLWYAQLLPRMTKYRTNSEVEKAIKGFLVILGPIMYVIRLPVLHTRPNRISRILFSRRIVQLWFNRKGSAEGWWHRLSLVLTALTLCTI